MKKISKYFFVVLFCLFFCFWGCKKEESISVAGLSCTEASFNFGRLSVVNGEAIGKHIFKIQNNTEKEIKLQTVVSSCPCIHIDSYDTSILAGGVGKIEITATFPDSDIRGRQAEITLIREEKGKPPFRITVIGYANFNTYFSKEKIVLNPLFRNDFKKEIKEFFVYNANEQKLKKLITKVWTNKPEFIEIKRGRLESEEAKIGDYYNHSETILISLNILANTPLGLNSAKIFIETTTREKKETVISWEVREKPVFDVGKVFYLISIQPREERLFSVCYNAKVGGKSKRFSPIGQGLEIIKTESRDNEVWMTLKYTSDATVKAEEKVGELVVETGDDKIHKLEIIAS